MKLRPYQVDAVQSLRNAIGHGSKRVILSSPTGSGKTEIGFEIIRGAQSKHKKVAFIANRIHLVEQTCRRLAVAGFNYGIIQGNNTKDPWNSILVCSIQTLRTRGLPEAVELLVLDEAHACAGTKAYLDIMKDRVCIGLSATPYSKGLGKYHTSLGGALFERVVTAARILDLIQDGYLVSADIWAPAEPDLTGVTTVAGDYNETQLGVAVDKPRLVGDIVSHWLKLAGGVPTVVFATNISHSKHIVDAFLAAGVAAEHIDCYTTDIERRAILERVANGVTTVISNVGVLAEGWDFPACKALILARPTKSLIRYLQMAGRVLRPFPGRDKACILDHSGVVRRLGFPWDDFDQRLDDGKPKITKATEPKPEALPKVCPQCFIVKPPKTPVCPACGFSTKKPGEVTTEDGDLVPVTKGTAKNPAQKALQAMGKQSIYAQLWFMAHEKGKSESWVKANYKEIFGTWPRQEYMTEDASQQLRSWIQYKMIQWIKSKKKHTR